MYVDCDVVQNRSWFADHEIFKVQEVQSNVVTEVVIAENVDPQKEGNMFVYYTAM